MVGKFIKNIHNMINKNSKKVNLVTGGAGFLGSHLIDKLMEQGEEVICIDNFYTGTKKCS